MAESLGHGVHLIDELIAGQQDEGPGRGDCLAAGGVLGLLLLELAHDGQEVGERLARARLGSKEQMGGGQVQTGDHGALHWIGPKDAQRVETIAEGWGKVQIADPVAGGGWRVVHDLEIAAGI